MGHAGSRATKLIISRVAAVNAFSNSDGGIAAPKKSNTRAIGVPAIGKGILSVSGDGLFVAEEIVPFER